MKLAVAVAGDQALPSAFVVWRGFQAAIEKAAHFGYHGIELALRTADDIDSRELDRWLQRKNLEVSCITTGQVFADLGLSFTHPDQAVRDQAILVINDLIDLAVRFGGMINLGRVRGSIDPDRPAGYSLQLFMETADAVCMHAAKRGVCVLIEPVNRYETNFINTIAEGADILDRLGYTDSGLMPDVFHMNIEEPCIEVSIREHNRLIRYIHLADSNRQAPGRGHLDFPSIFAALADIGYNGWASVEILPVPDADTAARQAAEKLLPYFVIKDG